MQQRNKETAPAYGGRKQFFRTLIQLLFHNKMLTKGNILSHVTQVHFENQTNINNYKFTLHANY